MKQLGTINAPVLAGDIGSPVNGDLWYNSSTDKFRKRENGVTSDMSSGVGGGGISRSINSISGTTTGAAVASTDYIYLCTGTFTYTQPTAVANTNRYTIKNAGTGVVTVNGTSSQTFDSATSLNINPNSSIDLISDNTNWKII